MIPCYNCGKAFSNYRKCYEHEQRCEEAHYSENDKQ